CLATTLSFACGGAANTGNSNRGANVANAPATNMAPVAVNLDPANLPQGLSASPIQQAANVPGVNSNGAVPRGATPTPGIPDPSKINKPVKPGATPTPGIPSAEEIRKMLAKPGTNANASAPAKRSDPPPMKSGAPMMKSNKP
ncbi:MAG: hypothetical protein ABL959_24880, partial [Pyrinomonadaceae bacterium]